MKSKYLYLFLFIILASCTTPPGEKPISGSTDTKTLQIVEEIVYAKVSDQETHLDIISPTEDGKYPIAIVVHGLAQSREMFQPLAEAIAQRGFVVYNINVVLDTPLSKSIHRIACAIRYARSTAEQYQGDPDRIVLVGHSGGAGSGAVAVMSGDDFGENCESPNESAQVNAFVGYEGIYNFATHDYINLTPALAFMDHNYLKEEDPDLYYAINVYNHIGRYPDITIRLLHGSYEEGNIPVDKTEDLYDALLIGGYDVQMFVIEDATHDDIIFPESSAFAAIVDQVIDVIH
jgi:acetyl esterase/lipase